MLFVNTLPRDGMNSVFNIQCDLCSCYSNTINIPANRISWTALEELIVMEFHTVYNMCL